MKAGDIILLENLRFNKGEEKNDKIYAAGLASLAKIYINDSFAVDHRDHASVSAIKKYLPSYAGLLLEKEIANLNKILQPKQPLVSVMGGAKIETKIELLERLAKKSAKVLLGGALANNFIAARGLEIGKSLADKPGIRLAKTIIRKYKNIILPIDVVVAKNPDSRSVSLKSISKVGADEMILDIGPKTIKLFSDFLRSANTIIWNGPLGLFEKERFKHGTIAIARVIIARSAGQAFGVVGGGETIEAVKMTKMDKLIDWESTGGGAALTYLSGAKMPGLKGIVR
jgi:3-phosphoglycerate kinase